MLSDLLQRNILKETDMYIFGASGHGKVVASVLEAAAEIEISGFLDDHPACENLLGYRVQSASVITDYKALKIIIGVGNNAARKKIAARLNADYQTAIHPSAVIALASQIGTGTVLMANTTVNPDAVIGIHCIINTGAVIEHDCILGDYVHISPNATLAGEVCVGEGTHVGIGTSVIQCIKIGKWATIGAGAVIINDVPDYAVVVGNPGKIIKYNQPI